MLVEITESERKLVSALISARIQYLAASKGITAIEAEIAYSALERKFSEKAATEWAASELAKEVVSPEPVHQLLDNLANEPRSETFTRTEHVMVVPEPSAPIATPPAKGKMVRHHGKIPVRQIILAFARTEGTFTTVEALNRVLKVDSKYSPSTTKTTLKRMVASGELQELGHGRYRFIKDISHPKEYMPVVAIAADCAEGQAMNELLRDPDIPSKWTIPQLRHILASQRREIAKLRSLRPGEERYNYLQKTYGLGGGATYSTSVATTARGATPAMT